MAQKRTDAERVKVSVFVSQDLHKALRMEAAEQGISLAKLAEQKLSKFSKKAKKKDAV